LPTNRERSSVRSGSLRRDCSCLLHAALAVRAAANGGPFAVRSLRTPFARRCVQDAPAGLSIHLLLFSILLFSTRPVFAHNPDTSYCRITITSHEVEFKFTYDLAVLQRMAVIDTNHDEKISRTELEAAAPAIRAFLREHVYIDLNQREAGFAEADPPTWPEDAGAAIEQNEYGQRLITFTFRNPVLSAPEDVTITFDFFEQLGGAHTVLGVFAWNGHEDEVIFTRFEPDYLYDTGYQAPVSDLLSQYFRLGLKHIFLGFDHLAFLLALLFVDRFRDLFKVITAFTAAHTLTLALAVLQIVKISPHLVEIGIALTIMYVVATLGIAGCSPSASDLSMVLATRMCCGSLASLRVDWRGRWWRLISGSRSAKSSS